MKVKVVKRRAAGEQLGGGGWAEICPRLRCSLGTIQCTMHTEQNDCPVVILIYI